jgi:hypothetical protein
MSNVAPIKDLSILGQPLMQKYIQPCLIPYETE